jgi:hypothetical protein
MSISGTGVPSKSLGGSWMSGERSLEDRTRQRPEIGRQHRRRHDRTAGEAEGNRRPGEALGVSNHLTAT